MNIKYEDVEKAIQEQVVKSPLKIESLGKTDRPNSWTFKIEFSNKTIKVLKVIKPNIRREEHEIKAEEAALEKIKKRKDINAIQYLNKGKLIVKNTELQYFIFSFIDGLDLYQYIARNKTMSERQVLEFLNSISITIIKLAEEGIIHQDIKPANIKITEKGEFIILDLGIARFIESDYKILKQQGPAKYLSPEQVMLGQKNTPHNQRSMTFLSDIYSSAVVALELLTGKDFYSLWKTDKRHLVSDQLRAGTYLKIVNDELRKKLTNYLELFPSKRFSFLYGIYKEKLKFIEDKKIGLSAFWHLHHFNTGTKILTTFSQENPVIKGGILFLSEHMKSIDTVVEQAKELRKTKWKIAVDPSTYKLTYNEGHFAYLKDRPYFRKGLALENFYYKPKFIKDFVRDVIEFQKLFNPDFYISPYFFVSETGDKYLDLNFTLFEETLAYLGKEIQKKPLLFGIALSKDVLHDENKVNDLLGQLILYPNANAYFIKPELVKSNNSPCSHVKYLKGLLNLVKTLTLSKSVLLSQVDQSCLGLFAHTKLSIAINPEPSIRKLDIEDKLNKPPRKGGGPKKEDKRTPYYLPVLLNDLDLNREFKSGDFKKLKIYTKLNCSCKYCISAVVGVDSRENHKNRNSHFLLSFHEQINFIKKEKDAGRKTSFKNMVRQAKETYKLFEEKGIKLSDESRGSFLDIWEEVFNA